MDGRTGSFHIESTDKTGRDFRAKGRLQYVGKHHLRFAETGEYFLKCGADAPENFLAYKDFDGDFKTDGHKDNFIKDWGPHIKDFKPGDPIWQGGKGKGILGAVNYLASKGMNVFSFLTMNIIGDDQNVFPYTTYDERLRMDVSRLDQWEIVFGHGTRLGMYLHFKTMETENELLLDNARKNALWGNIMAGGAGVEWYFGYQHPHSDLTCQDWRTREKMWDQCRYALEFFRKHDIPFWDMKCQDEMTENTDDYVLCKPGEIYLVYLKHGPDENPKHEILNPKQI